jgi:MFS family permease
MVVRATGGRVSGGSLASPLRVRVFRSLWLANLGSNFGWLIQGTAAGWLMTSLAGTADLVALVQAAVQAPIVFLSLFAGAAADIWDRRRVLLIAQFWMLGISLLLTLLTATGYIAPWSLLLLTFALGLGVALQGPAFQAAIRELVPMEDFPAAVTLNSLAFNFARAVAPAMAGFIIAASGAQAAFFVNAVTYVGLIAALIVWRRQPVQDDLPREPVGSAIVTGFRYAAETVEIRAVFARSAPFAFAAAAPLALLPLVAREILDGGPLLYGVLLGAFGAGAMGGAFLIHPVRQRLGTDNLIRLAGLAFALQLFVLGLVPYTGATILALAIGGVGWLTSFTSFNIAVQTSAAFWVQARVYSLYQTIQFAAMAVGSWIWGEAAEAFGLEAALVIAGVAMLLTVALAFVVKLPSGPAPDLRPSSVRWPEPVAAFPFRQEEGPVLVLVEYRISAQDARAFARAMDEVGHLRRRNGASTWQVFQDVADAEHWVEAFTVSSWLDYRRQTRRGTAADEAIEARAVHYHKGDDPPVLRHMIARRFDRAGGG